MVCQGSIFSDKAVVRPRPCPSVIPRIFTNHGTAVCGIQNMNLSSGYHSVSGLARAASKHKPSALCVRTKMCGSPSEPAIGFIATYNFSCNGWSSYFNLYSGPTSGGQSFKPSWLPLPAVYGPEASCCVPMISLVVAPPGKPRAATLNLTMFTFIGRRPSLQATSDHMTVAHFLTYSENPPVPPLTLSICPKGCAFHTERERTGENEALVR